MESLRVNGITILGKATAKSAALAKDVRLFEQIGVSVLEKIVKPSLADEFYTDEKCYILESSNSSDDEALSIARARVLPGVTTAWHRLHRQVERYYILSGVGCVEIGDLPPENVEAGDVVIIPPMCKQRITNTSGSDLVFLAMCTPRFEVKDYEDLEK